MLLNTLLAHVAPHECLSCSREGLLVCDLCKLAFKALPERCYRCHALTAEGRTCQKCRQHTALFKVQAYAAYEELAKELVWQLKFQGAQAAAGEIASLLLERFTLENVVLVPVPTASSRVRRRGYDQAQLIARSLALRTGLPYATCLKRLGQHHQVGATRQQRITQLQESYRCTRTGAIENAHVLLIDDVLTTGATLESAAAVIKAAGAKRVSGLVFAQA